jgi:hypothetical protein
MAVGTASAAAAAGKVKAATPPGAEPAVGDPTARVKTNKNAAKIFGGTSKVPMHGDEVHNSAAPFKSKNMSNTKLKDLRSNDKNIDLDKGNNMPVKRSGFGPSTAFGGVSNPELNKTNKGVSVNDFDDTVTKSNSPAEYAPFKMMGHEHPGIKQRTPAALKAFGTKDSDMPEKISTTPGKYAGGTGSSPAKLGLFGGIMDMAKKKWGKKNTNKTVDPIEGAEGMGEAHVMGAPVEGGGDGGTVPPHGDEAHTGGAIGGEPEGFQAMGFKDFKGMSTKDRGQYMKGLNKDDLKTQMQSNHKSMMGGGGGSGWGGFSSAIGGMFSDVRLKEKIEKTGKSPSGIPTYEFNYIGDNNRYSGVMAQDLIEMNIDAVSMDDSGFYKVDYNNIDVDIHLIN